MTGPDEPQGPDPLALLKSGQPEATERFVREHAGWMLAVARRILKDNNLAEDAVQGAFANIFKALDGFDGRSAVKTWMHAIVVNQALMLLRRQKRLKEDLVDDLQPVFDRNGCRVEDLWTTLETPETLMQQSQLRERVKQEIEALPDAYRVVLLLRDVEELSTAETAAALDMSEAAVKVRLHRARAALKKRLEPMMRGQAL